MSIQNFQERQFTERRLCHVDAPRPYSRPQDPDKLPMAEFLGEHGPESAFHGHIVAKAKEMNAERYALTETDIIKLNDDALWRKEWKDKNMYLRAAVPAPGASPVKEPSELLMRLTIEERVKLLQFYVQTHFPKLQKTKKLWDHVKTLLAIKEIDAGRVIGDPEVWRTVQTLMALGEEMQNGDATFEKQETHFATVKELREATGEQLRLRYKDSSSLTSQAAWDFSHTMELHEGVAESTLADPLALSRLVQNDATPFAAALRYDWELPEKGKPIFTKDDLANLVRGWRESRNKTEETVANARREWQREQDAMMERNRQPFAEKMQENFAALPGWQKWTAVGAVIAYFSLRASGKIPLNKWFASFEKAIVIPGAVIGGFYLSGARKMLDNTVVGNWLWRAEQGIGEKMTGVLHRGDNVMLFEDRHLDLYASLIKDIAKDELKDQVVAMEYLSLLPLADIAACFTLKNHGRSGVLDVQLNSQLALAINESFPMEAQAQKARQLLAKFGRMEGENSLGDTIAHVCYLLGAAEQPDVAAVVEKERAGRPYDSMPDGSEGRRQYEILANAGKRILGTKQKDPTVGERLDPSKKVTSGLRVWNPRVSMTWVELIQDLVAKGSPQLGGKEWVAQPKPKEEDPSLPPFILIANFDKTGKRLLVKIEHRSTNPSDSQDITLVVDALLEQAGPNKVESKTITTSLSSVAPGRPREESFIEADPRVVGFEVNVSERNIPPPGIPKEAKRIVRFAPL